MWEANNKRWGGLSIAEVRAISVDHPQDLGKSMPDDDEDADDKVCGGIEVEYRGWGEDRAMEGGREEMRCV